MSIGDCGHVKAKGFTVPASRSSTPRELHLRRFLSMVLGDDFFDSPEEILETPPSFSTLQWKIALPRLIYAPASLDGWPLLSGPVFGPPGPEAKLPRRALHPGGGTKLRCVRSKGVFILWMVCERALAKVST